MAQTQLATRVDERVKKAVEAVCHARGLKMNRFIKDASIDIIARLADRTHGLNHRVINGQ